MELVQFIVSSVSIKKETEGPLKGQDAIAWADVNAKTRAKQTAAMLALLPASTRRCNRKSADWEPTMCLLPVQGEVRTQLVGRVWLCSGLLPPLFRSSATCASSIS